MPQPKDVPSLLSLCGQSVEDALVNLSKNFLTSEDASFIDYSDRIESCKIQLCKIPSPLHNILAEHCLKAANRIAVKFRSEVPEKLFKSQVVVQHLVSIVTLLKLKQVHFLGWSKPVQASLLTFLWKMTHLEILRFEHPQDFVEFEFPVKRKMENLKKLHESVPFLTNLIKFSASDCTDEIIATLCENCKLLEEVDVRNARKVTDKSIDSLIRCTNLRKVFLTFEITDEGFLKLLLNSKNLIEIGDLALFDALLNILETDMSQFCTFQTQHIGYIEEFDGKYLPLISKYFPCIKKLDFLQNIEDLPDFSCLDSLQHTEEVDLSILAGGATHIEQYYSLKSQVLTSLCLTSDVQVSISRLINVGLQCPNLKSLKFEGGSFVTDVDFLTARSLGRPFQKLKTFWFDKYESSSSASGAEFILILATNIEEIYIDENGSLTDIFLTNILRFNALEELRSLIFESGNNVSLNMLKSIVLNCKKLTSLGNFGSADDASSKEKFESLEKFLTQNNYNINLR